MEKVVGYRWEVTNISQTEAQMQSMVNTLLKGVEAAKMFGKELDGSLGRQSNAQIKTLNDQIKKLEKQLEQVRKKGGATDPKQTKEATESYEELVKQIEELAQIEDRGKQIREFNKLLKTGALEGTEAYDDVVNTLADLKNQQQAVTQAVKDQQRELERVESAAGSYRQMNAELVALRRTYKELSAEEREANVGMLERIEQLDIELKELDASMGQFQRNVGNYQSAFEGLFGELDESPGIIQGVIKGVDGLDQAFKFLLANPIVAVIAAIAVALKTLFDAFKRTEQGANLFAQAGGVVQGLMTVLSKTAQGLADGLVFVFTKPQEALQQFGDFLVTSIINRLVAVLEIVGAVGDAIGSVLSGDFDEAAEAADRAGEAATKFVTGLDAQQQRDFAKAVQETTNFVLDQAKAFADLEASRRSIARTNQQLVLQAERLATQEALATAIADDATKSFAEREEAARRARELLISQSSAQVQIAKNELSLINEELRIRQAAGEAADELRAQQTDALAGVIQAERDLTLAIRDNEKQRAELRQDRLERDLDILIDGVDNQKTINERLLRDETLSFEERRKLAERTDDILLQSFNNQIAIIQQFTDERVDANALLESDDARVLNERIRALGLSEIIEGRLLEVVRDRRTAIQDLAEANRELEQAEQEAIAQGLQGTQDAGTDFAQLLLEQRLITQEEFNVQSLDLEIQRIEQELAQLDLSNDQRLEKQRELAIRRAELVNAEFDNTLATLEQQQQRLNERADLAFTQEQTRLQEQFAQGLITSQELSSQEEEITRQNELRKLELERDFAERRLEAAEEAGIGVIDAQAELAQAELALVRDKNDKIREDEERTVALRQQLNNQTLTSLSSLFQTTEQLLSGDEEARRRYATAIKAISIGEVGLNLIREISQINASFAANADITQTTRALLIAAAVARSIAALVQIRNQQFAEGGVLDDSSGSGQAPGYVPVLSEGMLKGRSHAQGGIPIYTRSGRLIEAEGSEFLLHNGPESYIVNKRSSLRYRAALERLRGGTSVYNPRKRQIASKINQMGGGVRFQDGGVIDPVFQPLEAPIPGSDAQLVSIQGGGLGGQVLDTRDSELTARMIKAFERRMSTQIVYTDPVQVYQAGKSGAIKKRSL